MRYNICFICGERYSERTSVSTMHNLCDTCERANDNQTRLYVEKELKAEIEKAKREAWVEVAERIKEACPYDLHCADGSEQPCSCAKECDKIIAENKEQE